MRDQTITAEARVSKTVKKHSRPILVTGSHRSGSTWVGKMLALADNVGYISEPFNLKCSPGLCATEFRHWFEYVNAENESDYIDSLRDTLEFKFDLAGSLSKLNLEEKRYQKTELKIIQDYSEFASNALNGSRALMKDPLAIFSTEWLARRFDMQVIIIVGHPAAFASSLKKLDWQFPFEDLLNQPMLMRDHLTPFRAEIEDFIRQKRDIVEQAALLWKCIYLTVNKLSQIHPDWILVRHEDISRNPVAYYKQLYQLLDLEYNPNIEREIVQHSEHKNPQQLNIGNPHSIRLNSSESLNNWKSILSDAEVSTIRHIVGETAEYYYESSDW